MVLSTMSVAKVVQGDFFMLVSVFYVLKNIKNKMLLKVIHYKLQQRELTASY
jgi:hypothetical protein